MYIYIRKYLVAKHGGSDCSKLCNKLGGCNYQLMPWKLVEEIILKHRVLKNHFTPPFVEDIRSPSPPYIESCTWQLRIKNQLVLHHVVSANFSDLTAG